MGKTHPTGRPIGEKHPLLLQANIICLLLFVIGVATIVQHPMWFR
jgi:hypothetical protein